MTELARSQRKDPITRSRLEYWAVRGFTEVLGLLPRRVARAVGAGIGLAAYLLAKRLRSVGETNLLLAFPESRPEQRRSTLRASFRHLGWQLAEFAKMRRYDQTRTQAFIRYEGLENYLAAKARGKGVLVLTGHLGAWELSSFYHSLKGFAMGMVIRRLDNPLIDRWVNGIRTLHGNRVLHKDDFARGLLKAMHQGQTVGILMDTNMTPPQGVFVPFFGKEACTASGLARVAARSGATVLPGFLLWDVDESKYLLHFGPALELTQTGDPEADAHANTALFTATLEQWIRRFPEQWLWVHRRWKTRPAGEQRLYA